MPGASNRTLRQFLAQGRVSVNGKPCSIAKKEIVPGDVLEIGPRRAPAKLPHELAILFEDNDILIILKPAGLLTVATEDERERTAYFYLRQYLQLRDRRQKLFIVHRLDKYASGVLVFAKSERMKSLLQGIFMRHEIQRKYWAVVEGNVEKASGTIRSRLAEDKSLRMHSTKDEKRGKASVTHFRVLRRTGKCTALEVTLETGRKNQIRAHLSEMGHPIAGDRAYGSTQDPLGRLGLHAFLLGFKHPATGEPLLFRTAPPPEFRKYLPVTDS
jgi:23S rRNA pseudouridine1911/1915/1917 synthase